jgi:DUF971 family protein
MGEAPRRGPSVEPREIMQEGDAGLRINWADGRVCLFAAPRLRRLCPCAQCVNEFTGERMLKAEAVSEDLGIEDVGLVGRYALTFRWSDGHDTGIYSFRLLREICESDGGIDKKSPESGA